MDRKSQINYNYLKFFIEAAESNSLQEVANKMGYELSNVSARISDFEKQLGVKLFTRNPLKLTEIGRDIYDTVVKGYRDIEFANIIAESKNKMEYAKISIGCSLNMAKFFLMDKIRKAVEQYPSIQINLDCEVDYKKIIEKIKNNFIQFALLDFIPDNSELKNFEIKKIFDTEYIFVSNKEIKINDLKQLNNYRYITSDNYKFTTLELKEYFEKNNVEFKQSMICSITEARICAAKMGLGLAYVLKDSVTEELKNKELYEVKVPIELPKTSINLIYIKDRLTKVDKQFIRRYLI